ncbi:hypothetical protein DFP72DRAFT_1164079 [Ephemerocybe angulata]|uniref:NAD(P)-binding protein n=1 Tax=Ephemerocybe angulata TaxID=980116 RepID=A0A8H6ICN8_9AGAR|nr:hypothetical protein DFP72DRAFT_1164079 [Tulosesus angulatus]
MKKPFRKIVCDQYTKVPPVAQADLTGKTVIVVGANTGLGFEASKHLARMNPEKLILACRNEEKGRAAAEAIREATGFSRAEVWKVDLSKFSSVVAFADRFEKEGGRLDILLANAGVGLDKYRSTEDGWEESLQVNNLSTSLLCLRVAPRLVETSMKYPGARPRIVVVSSELHYNVSLPERAYDEGQSAFELLNSREYCAAFERLLHPIPIRATEGDTRGRKHGHPWILLLRYSDLARNATAAQAQADRIAKAIFGRSTEKGARQLVYAAVGGEEKIDTLRGAYINLHKADEPGDYVLGEEGKKRRDKLWNDLVLELSKVDGRVLEIVQAYPANRDGNST